MSLILFPNKTKLFSVIGIGKVTETISNQQSGRVRFQATYWNARFPQTKNWNQILPGQEIKVIGRQGLTLLVIPLSEKSSD